jgi:shikimate dehydrogenase
MLSGRARVAGVIGWPVEHSRSPRLHGYWLRQHRIDGAYVPLPVRPADVVEALKALPKLGLRGVNVTVPHKEAAFAAADTLDSAARRIGAVNTLVVDDRGRLRGSNTDAFGFLENLRHGAPRWRPAAPAAVLGAGGAARAVVVSLLDARVREVRVLNRTRSRAEALARDLGDAAVRVLDWAERGPALDGVGLLVNTTSLGMQGQPALDLDLARLPRSAVVNDIVYVPLETPLLAAARDRGNPVVDGLGMLLHQARPGFEAWFGLRPEVTDAVRAFVLDETQE